jgi:hypothetical protein
MVITLNHKDLPAAIRCCTASRQASAGGSVFEGGKPMPAIQSRRQFLTTLSLAAAARLAGAGSARRRGHARNHREAGMIRSSPQKIIAEGADWRFLSELKRELKA